MGVSMGEQRQEKEKNQALMSASVGWGFDPCPPLCLLFYHPCPHSGEFWWQLGLSGVEPRGVCVYHSHVS